MENAYCMVSKDVVTAVVIGSKLGISIDRIISTSKGDPDDNSNLRLLCGSCNNVKGNRTVAYLLSRLKELEIRS